MRACSRCVAGSRSAGEEACGTGKEIRRFSDVPVQPVKAAARATNSARLANPDLSVPIPALRILLDAFDLLRGHGVDDRAPALLDPTAYSYRTPLQPLRVDTRDGEFSPMTLKNRYRKVARPTPSEIQIYCGAAFAHRQYLALYQCKLAPRGCNPVEMFRAQRGEIGVCPETAPRGSRNPF